MMYILTSIMQKASILINQFIHLIEKSLFCLSRAGSDINT
jgi:hypothetical protein